MWEDMRSGDTYKNEERAREAARESMDKYDYLENICFSDEDWLDLCLQHCPEALDDIMCRAENTFFEEYFREIEDED